MDSSHSSTRSSVSQNFVSSDVVVESFVPSGTVLNAFTEEIVAYEKESDETHAVKKLNALCTPESFVTHSNFDTPGGTVYYIPKVSADVLLVKGNVYDSVDDCVVAYMKYVAEAGFVVRRSCQKRMLNGDVKQKKFILNVFDTIHNHELEREEYKHLSKTERQLTYMEQAFIVKAASVNIGATRAHHLLTGIKGSYLLVHDSKCSVEGSEVCIIKYSPYVYEMPNKKKKPQSVDKGNDKAEENDKVDLFFKKDGLYQVLRNVGDGSVVCSCQLFVRVGILCKHIFCVFKNANVEMIPQQYILRRWTKNLIPAALRNKRNRYGKKNVVVENYANEATSIVDHCVHLLSKDEPRLGAFVEKLKSLKKEVEADCPNPPSKNKTDNLEQLVGVPKPPAVDVNNPTVGSTKGRKKLRIKGGKEKAIEKSLKGRNSCSLCGGTDHNKRTCPRRFEGQDEVVVQKEVGQEEVVVQKEVCQEEVVQEKVDLAEDEEELFEEDEDLIHE
ncbi:protein FAR1-related sequence 5 [Tanacetum coccineum]